MQELHSKEFEENRWVIELEQVQWNDIQCSITYDRSYASNSVSNKGDQVSLEEPSSKVVTYEEKDQASLQELLVLSNKREDEKKELGEEPLGQSKDAGMLVETILFMKWKTYNVCLLF